jgi:hypothetical protein
MGVPLPIIFVIVMIMSMFAVIAFMIYKKRDSLLASQHTIDKIPSNTYTEQEEKL